jgi:50S ribosomal subunit-associated GTPase HflX
LNKVDRVPPQELAQLPSDRETILVSSLQHTGLEQLLTAIEATLAVDPLVESSFRLRNPKAPASPRSKAKRSSFGMLPQFLFNSFVAAWSYLG